MNFFCISIWFCNANHNKGIIRQLLIFSDRPLTWVSPIMTISCLLQADITVFFEVFSFTLVCSDALCFIIQPVSFLDIHPLIMLGMM
jgi:hypothetical protein